MSGFGGAGANSAIQNLLRQQQNPSNANGGILSQGDGGANANVGPGEPQAMGQQYAQQGTYNTLAQDMSRGYMGPSNFAGGQFGYTPFGNPFGGMNPYGGGYGGGYGYGGGGGGFPGGGYGGGFGGYGGGFGGYGGGAPWIMGGGANPMAFGQPGGYGQQASFSQPYRQMSGSYGGRRMMY